MNIFSIYQKKIIIILRKLSKKKLIKIPANISGVVVELPPKNQKADISCNAALILAKINNKSPQEIAEILKENFLLNFKEFENISIAGPGFINIQFRVSFWKKILLSIIKSNTKFFTVLKKLFLKLLMTQKTINFIQKI